MITEAITHGEAAGAGRPANGAGASATTAAPSEINSVVASGSSPRLIAGFQPAWQAAANSTAAKTIESMAGVFHVASSVMRGLVPGIHVFLLFTEAKKTGWSGHKGVCPSSTGYAQRRAKCDAIDQDRRGNSSNRPPGPILRRPVPRLRRRRRT